jgi:hypothetical protein
MALSSSQLEAIAKQVYQKFPDLKGASPVIQSQVAPGAKSPGAGEYYLVTFKGGGQTADRKTIFRVVRVTADTRGRVIKISTSR